ncbi:MAG: hypothetical protein PHU06_12740 [Gallionella sp.]|nr:hypothetical protein [Gallionella sp.]MDD4959507.1 hypothetical protein [Gallionella sp.]
MGCITLDIAGTTLTEAVVACLPHPLIGGVILFTPNYQSRRSC